MQVSWKTSYLKKQTKKKPKLRRERGIKQGAKNAEVNKYKYH